MYIFICQTPFQLYYSQLVLKQIRINEEKVLIIHSNLKVDDLDLTNITFKKYHDNISFKELKSIFREINSYFNFEKKVKVFLPHIGGLISNYIFYTRKFNKKKEINFYYEGMLYFYDYRENLQAFHIKRFIASLFLGFIYRYSPQIFPFYSKKIEKIYSPLKSRTKGRSEDIVEVKLEIPVKDFKRTSKKHNLLILGGPIDDLEGYYRHCLNKIIEDGLVNEVDKIYYKGHPRFLTHNKENRDLFDKICKEFSLKYEELDILKSLEEIINLYNVKNVISYYSSSLINLQLLNHSFFDIQCFITPKVSIDKDLEETFNYLGVKIIRYE